MMRFSVCAISLLLASCAITNKQHVARGVMFDATMNTATIVTQQGDTLSFSTMDANRSKVDGLLLGDTLELFYKGEYKQGMSATKMIQLPNYKSPYRLQ